MKTLSIYLAALIAGGLIAYMGARYSRALDDLHNISLDIRAIREPIAPFATSAHPCALRLNCVKTDDL